MSSDQYQKWKMNGTPYVQTEILHGADGKGKFMSSFEAQKSAQRSWLSCSRSLLGTWASGRNNNNGNTTAIGTQLSNQDIMMTASISSHSHYNSNQDQDYNMDYVLQISKIRNMV